MGAKLQPCYNRIRAINDRVIMRLQVYYTNNQQLHLFELQQPVGIHFSLFDFMQALSATDLSLVEFACETIDPSLVFGADSCALEQSVLLSLIQQLSADLHSKTVLQHRYDHI